MRRIVCFLLTIIIVFSMTVPAFAAETTQRVDGIVKSGIISALNDIEGHKESFGLDIIQFEGLQVGSAIRAYEYTEEGYVELRSYYPLFSGTTMVAMALNMGDGCYQVETMLANAISKTGKKCGAIIYDKNACYLYDGKGYTLLWNIDIQVKGRCQLSEDKETTDFSRLQLSDLTQHEPLGYCSNKNVRAQTYYSCNVGYVTARPYSNLCWAGACAMIINYLKGTSYTAAAIAQNYFGSTDVSVFNQGLSIGDCSTVLSSYGCNYGSIKNLSNNLIFTNIYNGYPLLVSCDLSNGFGHACVISGVNLTAGFITVMDPAGGTYTVYQSGSTYTYVPSYAGYTITLNNLLSRLSS